ncbi:MAG: protein phosphatase 2C domain-containing protein [Cyanobacteria bacterium J06623_5]
MNGEERKYPIRQYVWALGHGTNKIPIGDRVDNRYEVVAPSIWLDTQPDQPPKVPDQVPSFALPYLKAYPYQLNLPGVYGICHQASGEAVLLLNNVPVSRQGKLMPAIAKAWSAATAFRQAYWLWQMISLWEPLQSFGAAASLLKKSNIRVEAWRVRLIGLSVKPANPTLKDLADTWETVYMPGAQPSIKQLIQSVCQGLRSPDADFAAIKEQVNSQLLLEAANKTVELQVAGATSTGPQQAHNEDACYPSRSELKRTGTADLPLLPRLAIVCDGVGGHEGGEVASQRVVRSLQLQLRGLLAEAMEQSKAIPPNVVIDQIEAAIRVANNLIAQQNDEQGRADRQRMGTTLVMALVLPQRIETPAGPTEVNELYLTHIGDSRAYWITPEYCQQLTVDDDIAGREVSMGKSFYATATQRPDAHALSQAVGVREFEQMTLHTQRFLFESSGVLMLCSDGLSDNHQVEASWANYIGLIVKQIVPLDAAVESWIELANQKNGHDNVAVVLMHAIMNDEETDAEAQFAVSAGRSKTASREFGGSSALMTVGARTAGNRRAASLGAYEANADRSYGGGNTSVATPVGLTPASRALLYGEEDDDDTPLTPEELEAINTDAGNHEPKSQGLVTTLLALIVVSVVGVVGWLLWRTFEPLPIEETLPPAQEETSGFLYEGGID